MHIISQLIYHWCRKDFSYWLNTTFYINSQIDIDIKTGSIENIEFSILISKSIENKLLYSILKSIKKVHLEKKNYIWKWFFTLFFFLQPI